MKKRPTKNAIRAGLPPGLTIYHQACVALARARKVDEVKKVRDQAERLKLYARQAKDRDLLADACEIHLRAERRLGEMLIAAKKKGQLKEGRPQKGEPKRIRLEEAGIDRQLSAKSQRVAQLPEKTFVGLVKSTREKIMAGRAAIVDPLAVMTTKEKQDRRDARERVLGECQQALPDKRYGLIVADPEWRFEPRSRETGMSRAADNHYPTSETEAIAARDVASIAAKDCILALWATAPMLPDALKVMVAWTFEYKTHLIWYKKRNGKGRGPGYWATGEHELLLIGTRGKVVAPATAMCRSVIAALVGKHSAKPEIFLEILEKQFPTLPKIELNRRGKPRKGWDAWGLEAESAEAA
jgi:N6-adenosine-specific RNA methylase IME4